MERVLIAAISFADVIHLLNQCTVDVEKTSQNKDEALGAYRVAQKLVRRLHGMLDSNEHKDLDTSELNLDKSYLRDLDALLEEEILRLT